MNVTRAVSSVTRTSACLVFLAGSYAAPVKAQEATATVARLVADPPAVKMRAGEAAALKLTAYDAQGNVVANARVFAYGRNMNVIRYEDGKLYASEGGSFTIRAYAYGAPNTPSVTLEIP